MEVFCCGIKSGNLCCGTLRRLGDLGDLLPLMHLLRQLLVLIAHLNHLAIACLEDLTTALASFKGTKAGSGTSGSRLPGTVLVVYFADDACGVLSPSSMIGEATFSSSSI